MIVAYILLIGPISYLVLRRMDRRELAWVTAPVLVVLFTACSFGIGNSLKGSDVITNQISLIRTSTAGGAATVQTYGGILATALHVRPARGGRCPAGTAAPAELRWACR